MAFALPPRRWSSDVGRSTQRCASPPFPLPPSRSLPCRIGAWRPRLLWPLVALRFAPAPAPARVVALGLVGALVFVVVVALRGAPAPALALVLVVALVLPLASPHTSPTHITPHITHAHHPTHHPRISRHTTPMHITHTHRSTGNCRPLRLLRVRVRVGYSVNFQIWTPFLWHFPGVVGFLRFSETAYNSFLVDGFS